MRQELLVRLKNVLNALELGTHYSLTNEEFLELFYAGKTKEKIKKA